MSERFQADARSGGFEESNRGELFFFLSEKFEQSTPFDGENPQLD